MQEVTSIEIITLVIAVFAAVVSVASLTWQVAEWRLSGHRVKVDLLLGAMGRGGLATGKMGADLRTVMRQGFTDLTVVVRAKNVGRQPVTLTGYDVGFGSGFALSSHAEPMNPDFPFRLETGTSVDFFTPLDHVAAAIDATRGIGRTGQLRMRGRVTLATGKTIHGPWEDDRTGLTSTHP